MSNNRQYIYLGDKLTDPELKGKTCIAVFLPNGKVVRGRNRNQLVMFGSRKVVVLGRRLRLKTNQTQTASLPEKATKKPRSQQRPASDHAGAGF